MNTEKITVRVTETRQTLDVVVLNKRPEHIEVVLGEGIHSVKCTLSPTRNGLAYAGSVMGAGDRVRAQPRAGSSRYRQAQSFRAYPGSFRIGAGCHGVHLRDALAVAVP